LSTAIPSWSLARPVADCDWVTEMDADGSRPARTSSRRSARGRGHDRLGPIVATFCVLVVLAAGGTSAALLIAPGSTDTYFSWTLRPDAAAAMIGGLYLASAVVFAWALTLPWRQVRPLFVGVIGLTTPTFVLTLIHDEVFDFSRWQAVVWVLLFAGAPVSAALILATTRRDPAGGAPLTSWSRAVLAVVAAALAGLAVAIWIDGWRDTVSRHSPADLIGLTGAYLGAWCSFAAALTGWAAARGRWDDARLPLVAMGVVAFGLTVAFLRVLGDLRRPAAALVVSIGVGVIAVAIYVAEAPERAGDQMI
jgi:hypothetical protein